MVGQLARRCASLVALCVLVACSPASRAPGVVDDLGEPGTPDIPAVLRDAGPREPIDCLNSTSDEDADGDGFSRADGDCDDCQLGRGPGALDVPDNDFDEDCDGEDATGAAVSCDAPLKAQSVDPSDAAAVLGLCAEHSKSSHLPGLIDASWSRLAGGSRLGDARQVWLPEKFGTISAREGERLLVLSTGDTFGITRASTGEWSNPSVPPKGYPRDESRCPMGTGTGHGSPSAYNDVSFELTLRVPTNARSFSFDTMFFTQEYPDFVCSPYNDFFLAFVDPAPEEHADGNVLFDVRGDTIGVNTGLLSACRETDSDRVARSVPCEAGPSLLKDTGFDAGESRCASKVTMLRDIGGASTGWLHTDVPVQPGKIVTLRFVLWDSADPLLDSTVLIDNFRWSLDSPQLGTRPITSG
jgi:hypothetical protein